MALTRLSTRRSSSPNLLNEALRQFQDELEPDRKAQLLLMKSMPDAHDVLAFTAQLDRDNAARRRRGVASRFCTLLQSVQQYTKVMDTYSQVKADTTSLIWGSLKLTIHVANSALTYFEKLSEWFMRLGTTCPRFSEYQSLFSQSVGLQKALEAFYAAVVRFCGRAIQAMERSGLAHFVVSLWKPFEVEFAVFESELKRLGHEVKEEIELASARAACEDRKSGVRFRESVIRWRDKDESRWMAIDEYRSRSRKQRLLEMLSSYDYSKALKKNRKQRHGATCAWITQQEAYCQWLDKSRSSVFWLSGDRKSVMTAAVVDDLLCRSPLGRGAFISYFFCRDDQGDSLLATTILRSLLHACLTFDMLNSDLADKISRLFDMRSAPDAADLTELFVAVSNLAPAHFIVVDGLDECPPHERAALLTALRDMGARARSIVKLFFASRDDIGDEIPRCYQVVHRQHLDQAHVDGDIREFVDGEVQAKIETGELDVTDPALVSEVRDALVEGADGMFLWVVFQLHDICEQTCDEAIRSVIRALPKGLNATYEKALSRVNRLDKADFAQRVFRFVAAARRPLTLPEICEALYIEPGQDSYRHDRLVKRSGMLVTWCGNLVTVDEEDGAVQFAHHSVTLFLRADDRAGQAFAAGQSFAVSLAEADHDLGEVCVTYLSFSDFQRQLAKAPCPHQPHHSAITSTALAEAAVADNSHPYVSAAISGVKRLLSTTKSASKSQLSSSSSSLSHSPRNKADIISVLASARGVDQSASAVDPSIAIHQQFAFLSYARSFWLPHTCRFTDTSRTWGLWEKLILQDKQFAAALQNPLRPNEAESGVDEDQRETEGKGEVEDSRRYVSDCIIQHNHSALLAWMLRDDFGRHTAPDDWLVLLLKRAARADMQELLSLMLCKPNFDYDAVEGAAASAAYSGSVLAVRGLLQILRGNYLQPTPCREVVLEAAAASGNLEVVDTVLVYAYNVYESPPDSDARWSALSLAAAGGHLAVVDRLLRASVPAEGQQVVEDAHVALEAAANQGHQAVFERLLAAGARVREGAQNWWWLTALQGAALNGHGDVFAILLNANHRAMNTTLTSARRTALQEAAERGDLRAVRDYVIPCELDRAMLQPNSVFTPRDIVWNNRFNYWGM